MYKIDNKNLRAKIKNLFLKTMVCFSGCLMSSASLQKLFYGVCSALKCSFEEFVREKVVFPSYSSAIFMLFLPLGFNCGFISTYPCGSSTGVCSWGCPGGLGFAPVRAKCGGGAAAWAAGVLAAPGTQGSWLRGQQEIQCSRRVWQPVLGGTLQCCCLENPLLPDRVAWQATDKRAAKSCT